MQDTGIAAGWALPRQVHAQVADVSLRKQMAGMRALTALHRPSRHSIAHVYTGISRV